MTMFKSVMSGVALAGAAALLSTSALAEGLPSSGRVAAPVYNWTGFYAGANVGWAWGNADSGSSFRCPDNGCFYLDSQLGNLPLVSGLGSGSTNSDGFTGGVQLGYLAQSGRLVFGLEVDFNAPDLGGSRSASAALPSSDPIISTVDTSFSTDWLLTVRGRLGVTVTPTVLLYATGGLAVSEVTVSNSYTEKNNPVVDGISGSSSRSDTKTGWTVGGGVEWALGNNWSVKGEYLYVDLGSVSTTASVPAVDLTPNTLGTSVDLTAHIVRAGVNYKF
jgi:outer membrane immunogenic protein